MIDNPMMCLIMSSNPNEMSNAGETTEKNQLQQTDNKIQRSRLNITVNNYASKPVEKVVKTA